MVTHDEHVARHGQRVLRLQDGTLLSDEPVRAPIDAQAQIALERAVLTARGAEVPAA